MKGGCLAVGAVLLAACTSTAPPPPSTRALTPSPSPVRTAPSLPATAAPSPVQTSPSLPAPPTPAREPQFDVAAAMRTVRVLAEDIGPREATTPAYRRAASYVAGRLRAYGYQVRQQPFRVPAGVSWGIRVPAGHSHNVIATPNGFDVARPHLIVGAHLDTVPQAPGAEDNASGVAVLLELARLAAAAPTTQPVVFVAFGAEEPRGPADDEHHFGSLHYVGRMSAAQRRALTGMIALDRVGIAPRAAPSVRVCTGGRSPTALAGAIRAAAGRIEVSTRACENRTSDHWPFEKAGETVARLGGHPYAAYHSARDRAGVVQPSQLARTSRVMWEFLSAG